MTNDENGDPAGVYRIHHDYDALDASARSLSTTLIIALEDIADTDFDGPATPVLANTVDPDALDELFRPVLYRTARDDGHVAFPIGAFHVTIHADGEIVIRVRDIDTVHAHGDHDRDGTNEDISGDTRNNPDDAERETN